MPPSPYYEQEANRIKNIFCMNVYIVLHLMWPPQKTLRTQNNTQDHNWFNPLPLLQLLSELPLCS